MLLADYQAYVDCQQRASAAYLHRRGWTLHVDSEHRKSRTFFVRSFNP
jgi:hypothetical protein